MTFVMLLLRDMYLEEPLNRNICNPWTTIDLTERLYSSDRGGRFEKPWSDETTLQPRSEKPNCVKALVWKDIINGIRLGRCSLGSEVARYSQAWLLGYYYEVPR
jgi:hypothetical protein